MHEYEMKRARDIFLRHFVDENLGDEDDAREDDAGPPEQEHAAHVAQVQRLPPAECVLRGIELLFEAPVVLQVNVGYAFLHKAALNVAAKGRDKVN